MSETAHLELRVTSDGYVTAENRFGAAARSAEVFERALSKLESQQKRAEQAVERQSAAAEKAAQRQASAAERGAQRVAEAEARVAASRIASEEKSIARVKHQLMTEEQMIRDSENKRRRIIIENTTITETQRAELLKLSAAKTRGQLAGLESNETRGYGMGGMILGGLAVGGALMAAHSMMEVTREFDKLNASLITVTGSEKEAAAAFQALQNFAMTTPFTLREVVGAFVQLRNLGLNATGRELLAFGNMASAFGDTLDHMILAVGDAAMGINRPLKQFGVMAEASKNTSKKLSEDGKTVTFTFRGMSTEVEQSATAIQEYLVKLSENNFANAMANRMNTLDGALSNLKDGWDKFALAITQSGIEAALAKTVTQLSDFLNKTSEMLKKSRRDVEPDDTTTDGIKLFGSRYGSHGTAGGFMNLRRIFPIQRTIDDAPEGTGSTQDDKKAQLSALDKYMADANKLREQKFLEEYRQLVKNLKTKRETIEAEYKKEKEVIESHVSGNAALDSELLEKAKKKHDDAIEELDKKGGSRRRKTDLEVNPIDTVLNRLEEQNQRALNAKLDAAMAEAVREHEAVVASLAKKEDAERAFYEKNKKHLENYSGPDQKEQLARNEAIWNAHLDKLAKAESDKQEARNRKHDQLFLHSATAGDKYGAEEKSTLNEYQKALEERAITEAEYENLRARLHAETNRKIRDDDMQLAQNAAQNASSLFGSLSTVAENAHGKQSAAYKEMFAMQKGFAVAAGTLNMFKSISDASASGITPLASAALMIQAAAQGAAVLAEISSVNYSGAYDAGGHIPAGSDGIVGERGPELVRGPADVTSRVDTAKLLRGEGGGGGSRQSIVMNVGFDPHQAVHSYMSSTQGRQVINAHIRDNWTTVRAIGSMR